jgi:bisanhydrobacterioruberin hydratase
MTRFIGWFAAVFVVISGFFVAKIPVVPELAIVSSVFVLVFAWPSYRAAVRWLGVKTALRLLIGLGVYALLLETLAVKTGLPYGRFSYGQKIGVLLFDAVPWTVPFSWTPLMLLGLRVAPKKIWLVALVMLGIDLVLDPGAVAQGFWTYASPGAFYQVPLSNFFGWLLSGTIGAWLARWLAREINWHDAPKELATSGLLSLGFWTSVCFFMGLWIPALLGTGLSVFVLWSVGWLALWKKK